MRAICAPRPAVPAVTSATFCTDMTELQWNRDKRVSRKWEVSYGGRSDIIHYRGPSQPRHRTSTGAQ